jgi:hypothetical protein
VITLVKKVASSEAIWQSSSQTLTYCCFWSAVRNYIRPDTPLQINERKSQHVGPAAWNFEYWLPRYTKTIDYHCIELLQLLNRWQNLSRKLIWYSNIHKPIHEKWTPISSKRKPPCLLHLLQNTMQVLKKKKHSSTEITNLNYAHAIYLFNIYVILCTGFKQLNPHLVCKSLGILCQYYFPVRCIIFVSNCNKLIFQ